jgi:hypothetical protein
VRTSRLTIWKYAAFSAAGTLFVLLAVLGILTWISVVRVNQPLMDGTRGSQFLRYMAGISICATIQATILFVATGIVSAARGRFRLVGGILSAAIIFAVVVIVGFMRVLPPTHTLGVMTWTALPVVVALFQLLPDNRRQETSNQGIQPTP